MATARKLAQAAPREATFAAGEVLLKEGDPSGDLWIIRSGTVEIFRERKGRKITLTRIGAGEMLGTMTATTGVPRSASVLAVTEVKITIISKEQVSKLIAGLPPWALGFIKDLVNRVNYVNDLYIDHEVSAAQVDESPLQFIWRLTKMAAAMAETVSTERANRTVVVVDSLEKTLTQIMGNGEDVRKVVALLQGHGLISTLTASGTASSTASGEPGAVPIEEVSQLGLFANLIATVIQHQPEGKAFTMPLAHGERRVLQELAQLGAAQGSEPGELFLPLAQVEDEFRRKGVELTVEALIRAQKLGLVRVDKGGAAPSVAFDHLWLNYALSGLNLIRDFLGSRSDDGKTSGKKTLLY